LLPRHVPEQDFPQAFEAGRRLLERSEDRFPLIDREAKDSCSIEQSGIQATPNLQRDNSRELLEKPLIDGDAADQHASSSHPQYRDTARNRAA
jgi:hypothetical protein